ncbi:ABC transporter substrate-binding protein [Nocardioides hungaricus]
MPRRKTALSPLAAILTLAVSAAALTACGGSDGSGSASASGGADERVIKVGFDPGFGLPYLSYTGGTWSGYQVDLYNTLGDEMGVKFEFVNVKFDSMTASLQAKRIDIAAGGFYDTPERRKSLNIIDNIELSTVALVKADDDATSIAGFCGDTIALPSGNQSDVPIVQGVSDNCPNGESIEITYLDTSQGPLAVRSGRVRAYLIDNISAGYISSQDDSLKAQPLSDSGGSILSGDGTRKDADGEKLAQEIADGITTIVDNGDMDATFDKYGFARDLIPTPVAVNSGS